MFFKFFSVFYYCGEVGFSLLRRMSFFVAKNLCQSVFISGKISRFLFDF